MNAESSSHHQSQREKELAGQGELPRPVPRCANCDIEILWTPVYRQGVVYCCAGCAAGGPCSCDYSQYHSVNIAGVIHYRPDANAG
jgi:hypothetical protein